MTDTAQSGGRELTMLIVGDVFVSRPDPPSVFRHVADRLRSADFTFGNFEGVAADSGSPWPKGGANLWKGDGRQVAAVESAGFHAMGVSNNHILDFGFDGMFETLGHLDRAGIVHAGAGRNAAEAYAPAIIERGGCRIALLAHTSVFVRGWEAGPQSAGIAVVKARTAYEMPFRALEVPGSPALVRSWIDQAEKEALAARIADARGKADIVVCSFHWGISGGHLHLTEYQPELGRHAVDCGADLVFGHHPHLLQGVEVYKGVPIFYSLGNFTFARHTPEKGHELETVVIECRITTNKIRSVSFLPARGDEGLNPHILPSRQAQDVIALIEQRSEPFGTRFSVGEESVEVLTGVPA